jgi:hypothetical protein
MHKNIIESRLVKKKGATCLGEDTVSSLLLLLFFFFFRRERLERELLHIIWFIDRNNRRNFGGFLLFVNKMETQIRPVIFW